MSETERLREQKGEPCEGCEVCELAIELAEERVLTRQLQRQVASLRTTLEAAQDLGEAVRAFVYVWSDPAHYPQLRGPLAAWDRALACVQDTSEEQA